VTKRIASEDMRYESEPALAQHSLKPRDG